MKLSDLKTGDRARVIAVDPQGETGMRLIEMGLVKGAEFEFIRKAPLGDPVEIKLRGFMLALRKVEAARVDVELTERQAGHGK